MSLTKPKFYQLDTSISQFSDPITVLHQGATVANVDVGFLFNRANGLVSNVALVWSESANSFITTFTTSSGQAYSNIAPAGYANLTIGSLLLVTGSILGIQGDITAGNLIANTGVYASGFFYSNGTAFVSSSYGNSQVAAYLPTYTGSLAASSDIVTLYANAGTQATSINGINANIGAYQLYANANIGTATTSISTLQANISAANTAIQTLNANIGALLVNAPGALDTLAEIDAALGNNANFSSVMVTWLGNISSNVTSANTNINSINANLGAYQTYANANIGTATTDITTLFSNAATQQTQITSLYTNANANTAAYLTTATGNISAGNIITISTTETTAPHTGAIVIPNGGGLSVAGNAYVGHNLYIGEGAFSTDLIAPLIFAVDAGSEHTEIAIKNNSNQGSSDFTAYGDVGTDAAGWADLGMTGSLFSNPNYTITGAGDGYLFTKSYDESSSGNLVLATGELGLFKEIIFGVGSFHSNAVVGRFHGNTSTSGYFSIETGTAATDTISGALRVTGGAGFTENVYADKLFTTAGLYWAGNGNPFASGITFTGGYVADQTTFGSNLVANSVTTSTSTVTGALVVKGGVGIGGSIYVGGNVTVPAGSTASPSLAIGAGGNRGFYNPTGGDVGFVSGGWEQVRYVYTGPTTDYITFTGAGTGNATVIATAGTDANVSLALRPTGYGNVDIVGNTVALSNGTGSITSLYTVQSGNLYLVAPTVTISAPTTAGGITATANANIGVVSISNVITGGTGYTTGTILTMVGNASTVSNATFTVTALANSIVGNIGAISITSAGAYYAANTNPVTFTSSVGTGFTANVYYGVNNVVLVTPGLGYVEQPIITISGGTSTANATAYATVGSSTSITSTGANLSIVLPAGEAVKFVNSNGIIGINSANTAITSNAITATALTGNAIAAGGMGVAGNIYGASRIGFTFVSNSSSAAYQVFNPATGSIDTYFG